MKFISNKENGFIDLDEIKYIDFYGEYDYMESASYTFQNSEYKPFHISFHLKDSNEISWSFKNEKERNDVYNTIKKHLNAIEV